MASSKGGSGSSSASNGDEKDGSNTRDDGKKLVLKSPMGNDQMVYGWPLKKGKGSLRRSEDKQDEAAEILETIRWVSEDVKEVKEAVELSGVLKDYNVKSFQSMSAICSAYNKAVDKIVAKENGTSRQERRWGRVSRPHLRHILQKCYNKSIADPNELNNYEAFTPEVYGETSFELICQVLDKLDPIGDENRFVDLGSGVGQVVLQVAALTNCKVTLGIEKANTPAKYAEDMKRWFEFWMNFYGKKFSKFNLVHGDFLDPLNRPAILESSIVFVNNFAFGPEVDQHLKDIFADLADGARIFSSKSFCALNFRITDRNLSDIGTIMHISKMDPLKGSVSWTGKPVSYFLHIIDRAKLERYFQEHKKQDEDGKRGRKGRGNANNGNNVMDNFGMDESSSGSMDDSRASSIEKDMNNISITSSAADQSTSNSTPQTPGGKKWTGASEEDATNSSPGQSAELCLAKRRKKLHAGRRKGRRPYVNLNTLDGPLTSIGGEGEVASTPTDSNSSTPPPSGGDANVRPVRAVVANAAAISEAQIDMRQRQQKKRGRKPVVVSAKKVMIRNRRKLKTVGSNDSSRISGLDFLHKTMMDSIEASAIDIRAPQGCVNERLSHTAPERLVHEELPVSINSSGDGGKLPFQLQLYLEKCKQQYLSFVRHMKDPIFKERVQADLNSEKKRNRDLLKREKHLKAQIENLITDSLGLLKSRLNELGIQATSPPEFIEKAKGIVCDHHEFQKGKDKLESEIRQLEMEQDKIVAAKEKELYETMVKTGISAAEARSFVGKQIENAISGLSALGVNGRMGPLLNMLSDVTLTKCGSDQSPSATQIRQRQASKQKDWPEKRHKPLPIVVKEKEAASVKDGQRQSEITNNDGKNVEASDKKIVENGRCVENCRSNVGSRVMLSPRSNAANGPTPVEVIKLESDGRSGVKSRGFDPRQNPQYSLPKDAISPPAPSVSFMPPSSVSLKERRQSTPSVTVDLPKIDLSVSISNAGRSLPPVEAISGQLAPPHPDSRSRSSEQTAEDMSFASNKVNSTPRAEQFEDRLQAIIHNVLTGDGEKGAAKQQLQVAPPKPVSPLPKPMFSPVKRELLPERLPQPPAGVLCALNPSERQSSGPPSPSKRLPPPLDASKSAYYPRQQHQPQHQQQFVGVPVISRNVNESISTEMEKCREFQHQRPGSGLPPSSSHVAGKGPVPKAAHSSSRLSAGSAEASLSSSSSSATSLGTARMSRVIEDSIRGHIEAANRTDKEVSAGEGAKGPDPHLNTRLSAEDPNYAMHRRMNNGEDYRYSSGMSYPGGCGRMHQPLRRAYGGGDNWDQQAVGSRSSFAHRPPPPEVHSSSDIRSQGYVHHRYGQSYPTSHPQQQLPLQPYPSARKRTSQPQQMQLPPKKLHLESGGSPADQMSRGGE